MRWLLTREIEDSAPDCAALRAQGLEARAVPCIQCVDLPWPSWPAREGIPVTFLSSRRAALRYLAAGDRDGLVAAMSPSTSALLREQGVEPAVVAGGGVEALASAVVAAWEARGRPPWHLRYPTSEAGMATGEQSKALAEVAAVGPVDRAAVYLTRAPPGLAGALAEAVVRPWAVCFHSPSAVSAFLASASAVEPPPAHVVCFGRSTQAQWDLHRPPSWPPAVLAKATRSGGAGTEVVETIVSLEESAS